MIPSYPDIIPYLVIFRLPFFTEEPGVITDHLLPSIPMHEYPVPVLSSIPASASRPPILLVLLVLHMYIQLKSSSHVTFFLSIPIPCLFNILHFSSPWPVDHVTNQVFPWNRDFNKTVNMTAEELEKWLKGGNSRTSGWSKSDGSGESIGHERCVLFIEVFIPHVWRWMLEDLVLDMLCYAPLSAFVV